MSHYPRLHVVAGASKSAFDNSIQTTIIFDQNNVDGYSYDYTDSRNPVFNYGNVCAQQLFGMDWHEFTQLPSRLSAEPLAREERARLLARVTQHGYVDDYAGVRIAKDGTRFMIRNATVWNLMDQDGRYCGQAARFDPPLPSDILENV